MPSFLMLGKDEGIVGGGRHIDADFISPPDPSPVNGGIFYSGVRVIAGEKAGGDIRPRIHLMMDRRRKDVEVHLCPGPDYLFNRGLFLRRHNRLNSLLQAIVISISDAL